jgi:mannan endo-1,4-beta-mannosidase
MVLDKKIPETIFRHPSLDFASTHFYEEGTIDFPSNTVDAAVSTGRLMREALAELRDNRPFMDSEHGPIHTFKDHHKTLPEPFDDEYFRHMQWAHFCAGGAGGGMRWPNRTPHSLTPGMRVAQRGLARFLPLIDWPRFNRRNWNEEVTVSVPALKTVACGDSEQALLWLLRSDQIGRDGRLRRDVEPVAATVTLPELRAGTYRVTAWNTAEGETVCDIAVENTNACGLTFETPGVVTDMAFAIRRLD